MASNASSGNLVHDEVIDESKHSAAQNVRIFQSFLCSGVSEFTRAFIAARLQPDNRPPLVDTDPFETNLMSTGFPYMKWFLQFMADANSEIPIITKC